MLSAMLLTASRPRGGGLRVPATGFGPPDASAPFSVAMTTDLQYFFSASSCFSLLSTKPWNINDVSVHGRSSSWMYTPKRSWLTGTDFFMVIAAGLTAERGEIFRPAGAARKRAQRGDGVRIRTRGYSAAGAAENCPKAPR